MARLSIAFFLFVALTFTPRKESLSQHDNEKQKADLIDGATVYETENLIVKKLSNHTYVHISFLNTNDFGKVACNGMLVVNEKEAILFDTPTETKSSIELINFVSRGLKSQISAVIPTHFHQDCIGGIGEFEKYNIPVYASEQTVELLKRNRQHFSKPVKEFINNLTLNIGDKEVYAQYFGEGHTEDNIVGYFPEDNAVFGGCLIKEVGASKGYLGDAKTDKWSNTVRKIKSEYPEARIIIPGHGKWGGTELFDYTIELFEVK